jgi:hypothetical protein
VELRGVAVLAGEAAAEQALIVPYDYLRAGRAARLRTGRKSAAVTRARKRGEKYLRERGMFRSLRSGEVIDKRWLRFAYPTFWHYDVLRGLDYLREAGVKADERVREAVEIVIKRRHQNGRWPLNLLHRERIPVEMETLVGGASRWNTLRALRVLRWYSQEKKLAHRWEPMEADKKLPR